MKIVDLETFRKLPVGMLFMKFTPCVFGELCSKGETKEHDFLYQSITDEIECEGSEEFSEKLFAASENPNVSLKMDFDLTSRDGYFENNQLFAVYEKADVLGLLIKIRECLFSYEEAP